MKSKILNVLLSVAVAFGLWLYVITAVSPGSSDTYYNIPVVMDGESVLNERGMMITHISGNSVTMRLSGNRSDLSKVNSNNITLKADLSKIYEPGNMIPLNYTTSFPGDVPSNAFVIESKYPGSIQISVAWRTSKEIPVEVKWIGSAPDGFMTDRENRVLDYPTVMVSGPDYVVDEIEMATIEVDLNEQRESISQSYHYTLCDANGNPVDAELITTNAEEIHLDVKILRVKDVQLVCTLAEGGGATAEDTDMKLSVDTIRVSGSEAALDLLGDKLVVGSINLAEIETKSQKIFDIVLPEGISNLTGVTEVVVEIELSGLAKKDLVLENINSVNVPANMKVEIITEKMNLTVRGPAELVKNITADDIRVTVDLMNAEPGTATYKALITYGEEFKGVGTFKADPISASLQLVG